MRCQQAAPAQDLDRAVDDALRRLGGKSLGHRRLERHSLRSAVRFPRSAVHQQPRGGELDGHLRQFFLDELEIGERLPELFAVARILQRFPQRPRGHAARGGTHGGAQPVERAETQTVTLALLAQAQRGAHPAVIEGDLTQGMGGTQDLRTGEGKTRRVRRHDKAGNSFRSQRRVSRGEDRVKVRNAGIGDEGLLPLQHVVSTVAPRAGGQRRDIGSRVRFGHGKRGHGTAFEHGRKPPLFQLGIIRTQDRQGTQGLKGEDGVGQRGGCGERLANQAAGAELLVDNGCEPAGAAEHRHQLARLEARGRIVLRFREQCYLLETELDDPRRQSDVTLIEKRPHRRQVESRGYHGATRTWARASPGTPRRTHGNWDVP